MASVYRFPLCAWQNGEGAVTVRIADDGYENLCVTAPTRREAERQIVEHIQHLAKTGSWKLFEPDFFDAELRVVKFSVMPEYEQNGRTFPVTSTLPFRIPCVIGKREHGTPIAFLPSLGIFFDYHDPQSFERIAIHLAQRRLSGLSPAELTRHLSPSQIVLDTLSVTVRETASHTRPDQALRPLSDVAEHLGAPRFRRIARTWERDEAVANVTGLLRRSEGHVCLVGPSGCGKTSVLVEAVRRIERSSHGGGERRLFWQTSGSRIIAGMKWLGEWEERLEETIRQAGRIGGVLCVENLAEILRLGGDRPESSVGAFLVPFLQYRELRLVVEATPEEFAACERALPALADQLQVVKLDPFTPEQGRTILRRAAEAHDRNDPVAFPLASADRAHSLFHRFLPYAAFPGQAVQFLAGVVEDSLDEGRTEVGPREVEDAFSRHTGLPSWLTRLDETFDQAGLLTHLRDRVRQQDAAVDRVARLVAKFCAGLNDPARPIGVLLFCGPTGVGKTQMVRSLADYLFPGRPEKDRVVRLDMSEYAGPDAPERLLGTIGGQPSSLVRHLRGQPFSIVLLDEIEKASQEVFDVFLSIFEEGRLTDPLGRVTSFRSSLIVMTSNLGAGSSGAAGFATPEHRENAAGRVDRSAVTNFFRPEFFNRLDQVVYFEPLGREAIEAIARKEVAELEEREGLRERGLRLEIDDALVARVAEVGFDPVYGARPLQRAVEEWLALPLARWLSDHPVTNTRILATWDPGEQRVEFAG